MFENLERSDFECGYDPKWKEEKTQLILDAIIDAYLAGYKRSYIANCLLKDMKISQYAITMLVTKAHKMMISNSQKREVGMKERNLQRLEFIYSESVQNGDYAQANKAVDTLNKLCGLYKEKVEIEQVKTEFIIGGEEDSNN